MNRVYEAYKPLRNHLRKYNLVQSLADIWTLSDHLSNKTQLPRTFNDGQPHRVKDFMHQWDVAILTREIVLNASPQGALRLDSFNSLASAINRIRDVENASSIEYFRTRGVGAQIALASLYATVHRQFPWQRQRQMTSLMRYMKVFGAQAVETVLMQSSGLSIRDWYLMGMAISGHVLREPGINAQQDLQTFGISPERTQAFFEKLSMGIEPLRQKIQSMQLYDENWLYSWNPIEESPLIAADSKKPHLLYCPMPELVMKRFSQGLFYELKNARGYENPYGYSFQAYIGDVIHETFRGATYELQAEVPYRDGRNQKHGADWILMDPSGNLFIECKTKRVKQAAKMAFDRDSVQEQFEVLAKAIVQLYKNIADAKQGITQWVPNSRPIYPLVVTLEDWYLFGSPVGAMLKELVKEKLQAQGMDTAMQDCMPYTVVSSGELEAVGSVLAQVGIHPFLEGRHKENFKDWLVQDYAQEVFPDACRKAPRILFRDDLIHVIPEIAGHP